MFFAGAALAGCGFEPLYAPNRGGGGPGAELAATYVAPIPDRIGQQVRNLLLDGLSPAGIPGEPDYRLEIALRSRKEGLAIRQDEAVTRFNLILQASFTLIDQQLAKPVFRGETRSIASYNVVNSPFATLIAEQDAEARAARQVSEEIRNQLGVFFSRKTRS